MYGADNGSSCPLVCRRVPSALFPRACEREDLFHYLANTMGVAHADEDVLVVLSTLAAFCVRGGVEGNRDCISYTTTTTSAAVEVARCDSAQAYERPLADQRGSTDGYRTAERLLAVDFAFVSITITLSADPTRRKARAIELSIPGPAPCYTNGL